MDIAFCTHKVVFAKSIYYIDISQTGITLPASLYLGESVLDLCLAVWTGDRMEIGGVGLAWGVWDSLSHYIGPFDLLCRECRFLSR